MKFTLSLLMTTLFLAKQTPDKLLILLQEEWDQLTEQEQLIALKWAGRLDTTIRVRTIDDQTQAEGYHRCPDNMWRRTPSNGMFDGLCNVCESYIYEEG